MFWWERQETKLVEWVATHSVTTRFLRVGRLPTRWLASLRASVKRTSLKTYEVNWPQIHTISFQLPSVAYEWVQRPAQLKRTIRLHLLPEQWLGHFVGAPVQWESAAAIAGKHSPPEPCQCWKEFQTPSQYSKNG